MDPLTLAMIGLGVGSAVKGIAGGISANKASQAQQRGARQAQGVITDYYGKATGFQQPYATAGQVGLDRITNQDFSTQVPTYQNQEQQPTYQADQFNYQSSPGYQFQLQQGQNAVTSSAAGRGGGLSGATLKALSKYGTGLAAQDYGNQFNQYMQGRQQNYNEFQGNLGQFNTNRNFGYGQTMDQYNMQNQQQNQRYNQAYGLAGIGQNAANNLSSLASTAGAGIANSITGGANAQAAGIMGVGQAIGNTASDLGQVAMMPSYLGQYGSASYGGAGSAQNAFNQTPYGKAYNTYY